LINLYIVATPIGNFKDIGIRAKEILESVSFIVCENENEYKRLFGYLSIKPKKFVLYTQKNELEAISLTIDLLKQGEVGALISDCGTPLFEDPGFGLINAVRNNNFRVTSIPGANSLVTALSLSPFRVKDFYFAGFLPIKNEQREKELLSIIKRKETIIFMEAPYRLKNILELINKYIKNRKIYIPYNLTMEDEFLFYGTPAEVICLIENKNITKGEFLIIIEDMK